VIQRRQGVFDLALTIGIIVGCVVIWWLVLQVRRSALRLDRRIEEYREEGPPLDPYAELAALLAEAEKTKIGGRRPPKAEKKEK